MSDKPFPVWAMEGCEDALCLFACGFLGENVEQHVRNAGLTALCIDNDLDLVKTMQPLYPETWSFAVADAFKAMERLCEHDYTFDLVTANPPLALMERTFGHLHTLRGLANKHLVLGITDSMVGRAEAAGALAVMSRLQSGASWWAVW